MEYCKSVINGIVLYFVKHEQSIFLGMKEKVPLCSRVISGCVCQQATQKNMNDSFLGGSRASRASCPSCRMVEHLSCLYPIKVAGSIPVTIYSIYYNNIYSCRVY